MTTSASRSTLSNSWPGSGRSSTVGAGALNGCERPGVVAHFPAQLGSRRLWPGAGGAEKLGLMGGVKAGQGLIVTMGGPMPEVRVRAVLALGGTGTPDALCAILS